MTPLSNIDLLQNDIINKSMELEAARILLQSFEFPTDVLRNAHQRTTAKLGFEVHRLRTLMMAHLPPKPSADVTTALQVDPFVMGTPP
jgi:hypothetical protein